VKPDKGFKKEKGLIDRRKGVPRGDAKDMMNDKTKKGIGKEKGEEIKNS